MTQPWTPPDWQSDPRFMWCDDCERVRSAVHRHKKRLTKRPGE